MRGLTRRARPRTLAFGSISTDTCNPFDIFASLMYDVMRLHLSETDRRKVYGLQRDASGIDTTTTIDPDDVMQSLLDELITIAEDYTPIYAYIGNHPGDGADFGVWLATGFDLDYQGMKVADLAELPKGYSGEALLVNDHGNITLYIVNRGRARAAWSLV